jgi:peptide/nickel transport system substrate-binding protein
MMDGIGRRDLLRLLGLGAAGAALPECAFAQDKDSVTIAWPSDVPGWDPNLRFVPDAQSLLKLVFDQPLDQDAKLALVPALVTKWQLSDDGLSMPVELRDDVVFHDGSKMTADDFRYTFFERIKAPAKIDTQNSWRHIQDIEVVSPTKAVMKFASPAPTAPQWLAFLGSYVVPKAYMERVGADAFREKPVGTGPYKLVEWALNSRIVLERNEQYWGQKPPIRRVTIDIIRDPSARVAAVQSGQVDLVTGVPVREVERLRRDPNLVGEINPITRVILLQVRNDLGFADPNVRLAAHHAIDKAALSKAFYAGAARPLSQVTIPGAPGYQDDLVFEFSPAKATELLAKSGFSASNPAKIRFAATNGQFPSDYDIARAIVQMWKKVGIEAELESIELTTYQERLRGGKLPEATMYQWGNAAGDPEMYAGYLLDPKSIFSAFKSDDLGERIAPLLVEPDQDKRLAGYRDLNRFAVERGYSIPLLQGVKTVVYASRVGFVPYQSGYVLPQAYALTG